MELQDYLAILRKRWLSIAVITLLAGGAAVGASLLMTPMYRATTQLYVSVQGESSTSDLLQGSNYSRQQVVSYVQLVTSPKVLGPVVDELGLGQRADELAAHVAASSPLNSSLIDIAVTDPNPALAAAKADAVAEEFRDFVASLETPARGGDSTVKVSVVRDAVVPDRASSPNLQVNAALGLLAGLAVAVGVAVLREVLDTRVRGAQDVERVTTTSIVGTISFDDEAPDHPLIVQSDPHSPRAEAMRRLRTNVQFLNAADRPQSIVVTSSLPGEGKSTTTVNLAIALADSGVRVVLVDADLRRPSVAKYMGLEGAVGLTTVLIGRAEAADVIQPWGNGYLHVLPSGQIPPNPSELLGSHAMGALLDELTTSYDVVLVDTPPLLPVTDAAVLSKLTGGALVVVGVDRLHRSQLTEALDALETVDARVLGIVLNRQPRKQADTYAYYQYTAADGTTRRKRRRRQGAAKPSGTGRQAPVRPAPVEPPTVRPTAARQAAAAPVPTAPVTPGPVDVLGGPDGTPSPVDGLPWADDAAAQRPTGTPRTWPGETFSAALARQGDAAQQPPVATTGISPAAAPPPAGAAEGHVPVRRSIR